MSGFGWLIAALMAAQSTTLAGIDITVQLYNPANVTKAEVRKALSEAARILSHAGIEAHWLECGASVQDGADVPGCEPRTATGLFALSILSEDPREAGSPDALGFAVLAGRANGAAVVYSRIVSKLKAYPEYADCNLLAYAIAHELGHLLLHSPHHGEGVMKANWNGREFEAMRQRRLNFSRAEAQTASTLFRDRRP